MISLRYKIGSIGDIPFRITLFWVGVFALVTFSLTQDPVIDRYVSVIEPFALAPIDTPLFDSQLATIAFALALSVTLYGSVILHELGHVYGARKNNVGVNGITLWILGGAASMTEEPEDARAEFELTIAGPLVSLALGVTAAVLAYATTPLGVTALTAYFFLAALLNLGMLVLNLIPAFPLDGGRLLRAAFTHAYGYERGTVYATKVGKTIAVSVGILSILTVYVFGLLLAGFVFFAAHAEKKRVMQRGRFSSVTGQQQSDITFEDNTFVFETGVPGYEMPRVASLIEQHNGTVNLHVNDTADIIVVPGEHAEMYKTLASHHNASLVDADTIAGKLTAKQHGDSAAKKKCKAYVDQSPATGNPEPDNA